MLPEGVAAHIRKDSWDILPIFKLIRKQGDIKEAEMYQVFNMGIGITIVCAPQQVTRIVSILPEAKVIGDVVEGKAEERITID